MVKKIVYNNIFIITMLCFGLWWPTRHLPYFWDANGFAIPYANYLYTHDFRIPTDPALDFSHPPFVMYLIAISWLVGGSQLTIFPHIVMLIFGNILLISSYYIAKKIMSSEWSLIAACTIALTPLFAAQITAVYLDLPAAALALALVAASTYKRWYVASLLATLCLLTKFSTAGFVIVYAIRLLLDAHATRRAKAWIALPLLSICTWLLYHKHVYGYALVYPRFESVVSSKWSFEYIAKNSVARLKNLFSYRYPGYPNYTIPLTAALLLLKGRVTKKDYAQVIEVFYMIGAVSLTALIIGIAGLYHAKYVMHALFLTIIIAIWTLQYTLKQLLQPTRLIIAMLIVAISLFGQIKGWYPTFRGIRDQQIYVSQEHTRTMVDQIHNWQDAAKFLEVHAGNTVIAGDFPEIPQLTDPYQGYVTRPLNAKLCSNYPDYHSPTFIYHHPYTPGQSQCKKLIEELGAKKVATFERRGWWLELYEVDHADTPN